jgi:hypothetical protein
MLMISTTPGIEGGGIGVLTLEGALFSHPSPRDALFTNGADIIEEIISEEIVDETDRYEDNQSKRKAKRMTTSVIMRGCVLPSTPVLFPAHPPQRSPSLTRILHSIVERERRASVRAELPECVASGATTPLLVDTSNGAGPRYGSVANGSEQRYGSMTSAMTADTQTMVLSSSPPQQ